MKEYPKIETLYDRDDKFKVVVGKWRLPAFEYLTGNGWLWTEKVDGTNVRIMWDGEKVFFGGKTDDSQIPIFLLRKLQELFPADKLGSIFSGPVCLYGEGYGEKIQRGGSNYNPTGVNFVLFDVIIDKWWLERTNMEDVAAKLGIEIVPIIGRGNLYEVTKLISEGFNSHWGNFPAEGIVMRPVVSLFSREGDRIIAKLKTKDFGR